MSGSPGRSCPPHYRYDPAVFAAAPALDCEVLYIVGGLYGNECAFDRIAELFDAEAGDKRLVFNGDFNWFDIADDAFVRINEAVLAHDAIRGNVETELGESDDDAGCGCAYPAWVDDDVVSRSNLIIRTLRATAQRHPALTGKLLALPMWQRWRVGTQHIGIVHGDAESLAGWGFAQEVLRDAAHREQVAGWFERAAVDVFASSHTCLPVLQTLERGVVVNNGAAGMPNFAGSQDGLITRIALSPFDGTQRHYGVERDGVFIDAIGIDFDQRRWLARFGEQWPSGSPAHASYWQRIVDGPRYTVGEALR